MCQCTPFFSISLHIRVLLKKLLSPLREFKPLSNLSDQEEYNPAQTPYFYRSWDTVKEKSGESEFHQSGFRDI